MAADKDGQPVKAIPLGKLIYSRFRTSALIPILVIDLVLLLLYFSINAYISGRNVEMMRDTAYQDLREINVRETASIDARLHAVSTMAEVLQQEHQRFFASLDTTPVRPSEHLPNGEPRFAVHDNGALFKVEDNGGGGLYYAASSEMTPERQRIARESEVMDPLLQALVDRNELVTQAYINTADNMNRIYPFIPQSPEVFGADMQMAEFNFYFEADLTHNPERKPVWTDSYLDPAGQGWMVSCVVPIWVDGSLKAVTGLDVTMQTFSDKVLNLQLPWGGSAFLIDEHHTILAMPPKVEEILGLQELKQHVYGAAIAEPILRPEAYNLLKHPDQQLRAQLARVLDGQTDQLATGGRDFLVSVNAVPSTGWRIVFLIDEAELLAPVRQMDLLYRKIGYAAAVAMLLFYLLFFAWLNRGAKQLALRIATPLRELATATADLATPANHEHVGNVGVVEIDELARNFNTMQDELSERTEHLVQSRILARLNSERAKLYKDASLTDNLTGLANRDRLNARMDDEFERKKRDHTPWSLILLDIDHFKQVNDNFGHLVGDEVLKELGDRVSHEIRARDLLGRWGGEEFMVILSGTTAAQAQEVAEKIRAAVEREPMDRVERITVSCGVAECGANESVTALVGRVDTALYQAKHDGRNRVCLAESAQ